MATRTETLLMLRGLCGDLFRRPDMVRDVVSADVGRFSIRPHRHHDELQLDLLDGCVGSAIVDGESLDVDGVTLLTHYPGRRHGYDLQGGRRWHLKLAMRQLSPVVRTRVWATHHASTAKKSPVVSLASGIAQLPKTADARSPRLLAMIAELLSLWPVRDVSAIDASTVDDTRDLAAAVRLVQTTSGKPPSLDALAATAHLSRRHFVRRFREHFNCAPGDFINADRLAKAKALLAGGGATASETGTAVGFANASAFSRWFTRHVGQTPDRFRRDPHVA
ncbi:MAG: AraC family transcriptional regulator [Planctomycetota bacterium]